MNLAESTPDHLMPLDRPDDGARSLQRGRVMNLPARPRAGVVGAQEASSPMSPAPSPNPAAPAAPLPTRALSDVMARLGAEVAMPLTAALQRVQTMAASGRIDRPGLFALSAEIADARRVGMRGQQIARLAGGMVQQEPERLNLGALLREVLAEQAEQSSRQDSVGMRQTMASVEVMADPSLLATVLRATADWALEHARAPIAWRVDTQAWPVLARLQCRVQHADADMDVPHDLVANERHPHVEALDTLDWLLLRLAGHLAGIEVQREDTARTSTLTLRFAQTVNDSLEGASAVALDIGAGGARLPAGSQLLVLASRRDARQQVREAVNGQDLFIDYVPSVTAARDYCADAAPQALIFESAFVGEALRTLCETLDGQTPAVALIEIMPAGAAVEHASIGGAPVTRIGADRLRQQLAMLLALAVAGRR